MQPTTRRNLLKAAAAGSVSAAGLGAMFGPATTAASMAPEDGHEHAHEQPSLDDKRAAAFVSFGQWEVDQHDTRGYTLSLHDALPI